MASNNENFISSVFIILLLIEDVACLMSGNNFRFTQCRWDGNECEEIKGQYKSHVSSWPPGPYALPMPVDGCPESKWKGWEEGYLELTWRKPHSVLSETLSINDHYNSDVNISRILDDVTFAKITEIQSLVMGPYGRFRIKINFCYKRRNETLTDKGKWHNGSYGIYGDINGCPEGFTEDDMKVQLPKLSFWISDGFLPHFDVKKHAEMDELVVRVCSRIPEDVVEYEDEQLPSKETFILLNIANKPNPDSCNINNDMMVTQVSLYIKALLPQGSILYNTSMIPLLSVCVYHSYKFINTEADGMTETFGEITDEVLNNNYFEYTNVNISVGNVLADSYLYLWEQTEGENKEINDIIAHYIKGTIYIEWAILDVGRTVPVVGFFIPASYENDMILPKCFISKGKWEFLHFNALSCFYNVLLDTVTNTSGFYLIFYRELEGRFVVFTEDIRMVVNRDRIKFDHTMEVTVLTNDETFGYHSDDTLPCNSDLGMEDFSIDDKQISSSSERQSFPARNARPNRLGWCADVNDASPFIMVRLDRETIINGITISNWDGEFRTVVNGTSRQHFFRIGASSFKIAFGLTESNLTVYSKFQLDLLNNVNEPQHFRFYRQVLAKVVKLFEIEPLFKNMKCLRFEIHGCRKTVLRSFEYFKANDMKRYVGLVNMQDIHTSMLQNRLVEECERECLKTRSACFFVNWYYNGDCILYDTNNQTGPERRTNEIWHFHEKLPGFTSVKIYHQDNILSPSVMYSHSRDSTVTVMSYISFVRHQSVITSIGYPFEYGFGEKYKWVIQFNEEEYIRLVFTNISLNIQECNDVIRLDEEHTVLDTNEETLDAAFTLNDQYNNKQVIIDTYVNNIIVTFTSCAYSMNMDVRGRGFRALVQKQEIPTCFNVNQFNPTFKGTISCSQPVMFLSSLGFNNIISYDNGNEEQWTISSKMQTFRIKMLHFDVKCKDGSDFIIRENLKSEVEYCNQQKPPGIILSKTSTVYIFLFPSPNTYHNQFRLVYEALDEEFPEKEVVKATSIPDLEDSVLYERHIANQNKIEKMVRQYGSSGYENLIESLLNRMKVPRLLHKACSKQFNKCYTIYAYADGTADAAGKECWVTRQRLVSINSHDELKLVKRLLRTFKKTDRDHGFFEDAFSHFETVFYYAYIGNRRGKNSKRKLYEFWENKTPVTYSDWYVKELINSETGDSQFSAEGFYSSTNPINSLVYLDQLTGTFVSSQKGEPVTDACTRMSFMFANEDNTWEAIDCSKHRAFYFVCEKEIGNLSIDIKDKVYPSEYIGTLNKTLNGHICQRWDSQYPHQHVISADDLFPDNSVEDAANYCRAPNGADRLFCFTTNQNVMIDFCYANELLEEVTPVKRINSLDVSERANSCTENMMFYNYTLVQSTNDCDKRAVEDVQQTYDFITCSVSATDKEKGQHCNIKENLLTERCLTALRLYTGTQNTTISGKPCMVWSKHIKQDDFNRYKFPDNNLEDSLNYCRDITAAGFQWCYTTFPGRQWEICKVNYSSSTAESFETTIDHETSMFMCKNGQYIFDYEQCNGVVDCQDVSDELDCPIKSQQLSKGKFFSRSSSSLDVDPGSLFKCDSQEWISYLEHCNGFIDCEDASDERNCAQEHQTEAGCKEDEFTCGNGVCIHVSLVCNFIQDCADNSDEQCDFQDCGENEYRCASGQCIQSKQRCNALEDCWDGSDETNCQTCSSPDVFNCDFIRCIPGRLVCDGYPDCEDRTDELSCDTNSLTTCREFWEAGYRESKEYKLPAASFITEIKIFCDFSSLTSEQIIRTIFYVDLVDWNGETIFYTTYEVYGIFEIRPYNHVTEAGLGFDPRRNCSYHVVQTCLPWLSAAAAADDPAYEHIYKNCRCLNITIDVKFLEYNIEIARYCDTGELLNEDEMDRIMFNYTFGTYDGQLIWKNADLAQTIHLQVDHAVCVEDFTAEVTTEVTTFGCSKPNKVFDLSLVCVYNTDNSGTIIGCRTGSHLQSCEFHVCPPGTVKCPRSYCIPLRFVCDGVEHCPNAEDEYECGCSDSEREVIILHHQDNDVRGPDIFELAWQFQSSNGIIRSLSYTLEEGLQGIPFQHAVLNITEKEIRPTEHITRGYTCNYKALANEYLDHLQFTKKASRSLIFIQNNNVSNLVAKLMFSSKTTTIPDFSVYRIFESDTSALQQINYPNVHDIHVDNWNILSMMAVRHLPNLCREGSTHHCPGAYKCTSSKMCIDLNEVCDGYKHCNNADDEMFCDFKCPTNCMCTGLIVRCIKRNKTLSVSDIKKFPKITRSLQLRNIDNDILFRSDVLNFPFLYNLNMSNAGLLNIARKSFAKLSNLRILDLSHNKLTQLRNDVFNGLQNLQTLILDGNNDLTSLEPFTFQHLKSIRVLRITGTKLTSVKSNTFAGLNLEMLDLRNNRINNIEELGLGNLAVVHIRFQGNDVVDFNKGVFTGVSSLKTLHTPAYKFCCIMPNYVLETNCLPTKDEFSSCEDLMRISALQTMLWLIGLCALLGNILSVIYRLIFDRDRLRLGYGIFVTNLAVADFFMGVYLMIIAVADAVFRKKYIFMDEYWRNSGWCTFAGVLSTLSSEASVMFLCLITIDRFLVIKYPFGQVRLDTRKASMISIVAWIVSFLISLIPLVFSGYFQNKFYNKSGVCIALPLTRDRPPGWLYSILVFIGLNFVTFLIVAAGQWSIYTEISKTSGKLRKSQSRKKDLIVARNLLLVVATDFLCWFPIGCMGIMALSGYVISGDVYAWAAVFILPVNSALNPILYTLTAILGKKRFTPRAQEQIGNIETGKAKRFLKNQKITASRFNLSGNMSSKIYLTLHDYLRDMRAPKTEVVLKIAYQLTDCLVVLHKNGLVLEEINEQSIFVKSDNKMVIGDVQITNEPTICTKISEQQTDIFKLGLLVQIMILKEKD